VAIGKSPPSTTLTLRSLATRIAGRPIFEQASERIGRFLDSGHCANKKEPRQPEDCRGQKESDCPVGSEEEADSNLNLAGRIGEVAVGVGYAAKRRVEGHCWSYGFGSRISCAREDVAGIVDAGYVLVVEEIECLAKDFGAVMITEADLLGDAEVHVNGTLHLEGVTADDVNALAAIGTIDARS
jgi:hypothetical protein